MDIPDGIERGETRYILTESDPAFPENGSFMLNACYVYRPDEKDHENLSKRVDSTYNYVVHWTIGKLEDGNLVHFDENVMTDTFLKTRVKKFLYNLPEQWRAFRDRSIQLSSYPPQNSELRSVHASQNIETK